MGEIIYRQAACIPWRRSAGELQSALITSLGSGRWIIPKGLIDPGDTARDAAAKEVLEEAGLIGSVSSEPVGQFEYRKWGGLCRVRVFLMQVDEQLEQWDESDVRDRQWFTLDDAIDAVREDELRAMLGNLPGRID